MEDNPTKSMQASRIIEVDEDLNFKLVETSIISKPFEVFEIVNHYEDNKDLNLKDIPES